MNEAIHQHTNNILAAMQTPFQSIEVTQTEDGQYQVQIEVDPEISGILIGYHGEGIDALQTIINSMVNRSNQAWVRVSININDYRNQREEVVRDLALKAAESAKTTGKPVILNYLPPHERRLVHVFLAEDRAVETYSEGDGKYRRLIIAPAHSS